MSSAAFFSGASAPCTHRRTFWPASWSHRRCVRCGTSRGAAGGSSFGPRGRPDTPKRRVASSHTSYLRQASAVFGFRLLCPPGYLSTSLSIASLRGYLAVGRCGEMKDRLADTADSLERECVLETRHDFFCFLPQTVAGIAFRVSLPPHDENQGETPTLFPERVTEEVFLRSQTLRHSTCKCQINGLRFTAFAV